MMHYFFVKLEQEVGVMPNILKKYRRISGQAPYLFKSGIFFSKNATKGLQNGISQVLRIRKIDQNIDYMSNPLFIQRNRTRAFKRIIERIASKIEGWRSKFLSSACKAIIIRPVLQSTAIYTTSTFKIPKSVCKKVDSLICKFRWNSKFSSDRFGTFKKWKDICKPKEMVDWDLEISIHLTRGKAWMEHRY